MNNNPRATFSFNRGFEDGYFNRPSKYTSPEGSFKPFGEFDYDEGYKHGQSQAYWNSLSLAERRAESRRRKLQHSEVN